MTILFDTLKALEKLKAAGISDPHAHAMVETLSDAADTAQLATRGDLMDMGIGVKHDMHKLEAELKHKMDGLRTELKQDINGLKQEINGLRAEMKFDLASLEHRMTIRLGVMMAAMISAATALTHYLR